MSYFARRGAVVVEQQLIDDLGANDPKRVSLEASVSISVDSRTIHAFGLPS